MKTPEHSAPIMPFRGLLIALALSTTCAEAQIAPSLDLRLPHAADAPVLDSQRDDATPGVHVADTATSVHGAFSTGIGYSKAFGNSTISTADLDVNKRYDDGRTLNLHIDVLHSTGLPAAAPRDYVSRYDN